MNNIRITNRIINTTACIMLVVLLSTPIGCADLQGAIAQTSAWKQNAQILQDDLQNQKSLLEQQRASINDDSIQATELKSQIDSAIASAQQQISALQTAIEQTNRVLEEATNPTDSFTIAAESISPWVPAPAQGPLVLGAALIATLARSRNLKNSAVSIIQSIEHTMNKDANFKQAFLTNADSIRTIQSPSARKLIDSVSKQHPKQHAQRAMPI